MLLGLLAAAQATSVAIWAEYNDNAASYDLQTKLMATGLFDSVDAKDFSQSPSLSTFQQVDVVILYSRSTSGYDGDAIGDAAADYVDAGGGIVVSPYFSSTDYLGGRFMDGSYTPFVPHTGGGVGHAYPWLVADVADHPILDGVTSVNGGASSYVLQNVQLSGDGSAVAHWDMDSFTVPAVGTREVGPGRVVLVNLYPASSDVHPNFWDADTDGARLFANAALWAAGELGDPGDPGDSAPPDSGDPGDADSGEGSGDPCVDCDDDGYDAELDCNDSSSAVHPGADEVEDGIDNDCDGEIDEGCGGCSSAPAALVPAVFALMLVRRRRHA